jgi:transketolase
LRNAFSSELVRAAHEDGRLVLLTGDHGYTLFDEFRRVHADRFVNAGVAEQNMVGVAAGMAKAGLRPYVYGLSAFVPMRVLEQIKLDCCYEPLPVVFLGDGAGVVYSTLGSSHQCTEDVAALRALPHLSILSPSDAREMSACMTLARTATGPVYLRMGKSDLGTVHARPISLDWGRLLPITEGRGDIAWIATGSMVHTALKVAAGFEGSSVWSAPCLKPIDTEAVADICNRHRVVVTLEEHSVYGGLSSAVAEIAGAQAPTWICPIGVQGRFSKYCGSYEYLIREHGLDADSVAAQVRAFLSRIAPKMRLAG